MPILLNIDELAVRIAALAAAAPLTLVGVDGHSGAGKTTITLALQRRLGELDAPAHIVEVDHYYTTIGVAPPDGLSPEECYERHVDWRALAAEVIEPLRRGEPGRYRPYDWIAERWLDWVTVPPSGVVLIEGVFSMRPELVHAYDMTVYVDAPAGVRAARLDARPDDPVWEARWALGFTWYMDELRTMERADVVVSGSTGAR